MFKYLEVVFRHWFRFVLVCLVVPALGGGAALFLFQGKDGSAQLWVDTPSYIGNVSTASGWNQYLTPAQNTVDSLNQLVQTDAFYTQLGQALIDTKTVGSFGERDQVLSDVRTSLSITSTGSHLVTLRVECPTAQACIQVLNTTVSTHREWLIQTEKQQADVASQFYTSQLLQAKQRLQTAIDSLNSYLAIHPVPQTINRSPDPQFDRLQSDVQQAQVQVNDIQDKLQSIQFSNDAAAEIDQTALRVVDPPRTSGGRFTSRTKKMAMVFAVGAAVPGLAYLVFLGWIDRTIRNPKEIENRIGARVVATIGHLTAERS